MSSAWDLVVFAVAGILGNVGTMMIGGFVFPDIPYRAAAGFALSALSCICLAWIAVGSEEESEEPEHRHP